MTEAEWHACADPQPMLEFLRGKASGRKLRLFAAACCRGMWHLLPDRRSQAAVEIAERFADAEATDDERAAAYAAASAASDEQATGPIVAASHAAEASVAAVSSSARAAAYDVTDCCLAVRGVGDRFPLCQILRCVFGPVRFDSVGNNPALEASSILTLARSIYADRTFDRLPILADALEEAGCTEESILSHCRGPGPHVRGCWVLDLLLGKE